MTATVPSPPPRVAILSLGAFYFFYFALIGVYIIYLPKMLIVHGFSASQVGIIYAAAPMMRFLLPFVFRRFVSLDDRMYQAALGIMLGAVLLFGVLVDSFGLYVVANLF
jgi:PPP family 3-phenylpropionic acid transporter